MTRGRSRYRSLTRAACLATLTVAMMGLATDPALAAPANDAFETATSIGSTPFTDSPSTAGASRQPLEPIPTCQPTSGATVWYRFDSGSAGSFRVETTGSGFNTVVAVYTGSIVSNLTEIACNDITSGGSAQAGVTVEGAASTTYFIQVSGAGSTPATGSLALKLTSPANDSFGNAAEIAKLPLTIDQSTRGASRESGEPSMRCLSSTDATAWFKFFSNEAGTVEVSTAGSSFDTALSVYSASAFTSPMSSLVPVACNDNRGPGLLQASLSLPTTVSKVYFVQVGGFASATGSLKLSISRKSFPAPANDSIANAVAVGAIPFSDSRVTSGASRETDEPWPACQADHGASAWYRFVPGQTGTYTATTVGSDYDTIVAVYAGTAISNLDAVACNDDTLGGSQSATSFLGAAGATYSIQVSARSSRGGNLFFSMTPPSNDDFDSAVEISATPFATRQLVVGATREAGEEAPSCLGSVGVVGSVWYSHTPPSDGVLSIGTSGSDFDTVLAAYAGAILGSLDERACNDDLAGGTDSSSSITLPVSAGTRYLIQVGGADGTGNLSLRLSSAAASPAIANDDFVNAQTVSTPFTASQATFGAGTELGEPEPSCAAGAGASVWFEVTPATATPISVNTQGSDYDTAVAVHTGSALPTLTEVACNADAGGGDQSQVSFTAAAGTTYRIQVSAQSGAAGTLALAVTQQANDMFAGATAVGAPSTTTQGTGGATREKGEPLPSCLGASGATVWYRITSGAAGMLTVNTTGSSFDTVVALHRGASLGALTEAACNDDLSTASTQSKATIPVAAGEVVYAQAGGSGASAPATGNLTLAVTTAAAAPPANDAFASAQAIPVPFTGSPLATSDATLEAGEPSPSCRPQAVGSVWYRLTPSSATRLLVNAAGSTYDTVIAAYRGTSLGSLEEIRCSDDVNGPRGQVAFFADAGDTYYLQAASADGSTGTLQLAVGVPAIPANRSFTTPATIALGATSTISTMGSARGPHEPRPSCWPDITAPVWYKHTPAAPSGQTGTISATTADSDHDTVIAMYTMPAGNKFDPTDPRNLKEVDCSDDNGGSRSAAVSFRIGKANLPAIYFLVGSKRPATGGLLNFSMLPARPNDSFAKAIRVARTPFEMDVRTGGATREKGEPLPSCEPNSGASIWYAYTPATSGTATASTVANSTIDTVVAVYTGSSLAGLSEIACNDDFLGPEGGNRGMASFPVTPGSTYHIQVSGTASATGDVTLRLTSPANDDYLAATKASSTPYTTTLSTAGASAGEANEPLPSCQRVAGASVWFLYTPAADGYTTISTAGSDYDTILAAYTGQGLLEAEEGLQTVGCNDDVDAARRTSSVSFRAVANTIYSIQVAGFDGATGDLALDVDAPVLDNASTTPVLAPPANDDFTLAKALPGAPALETVSTSAATREAGEPAPSCRRASGASVWYSHTPSADTSLTVSTDGSDFDTVLAAYTGASLASLAEVACSDDPSTTNPAATVRLAAAAGTTYWIQASGRGTAAGTLALSLLPQANDAFTSAESVGALPASLRARNAGASREAGEPSPSCRAASASTLWYRIPAAGAARTIEVTSARSTFDTVLAVYRGASLGSLEEVACNDDAAGERDRTSALAFQASAGEAYHVQASANDDAPRDGQLVLTVTSSAPRTAPANDALADAAGIFSDSFRATHSTAGATTETGEPVPACAPGGGATVWYRLSPRATTEVLASTEGSGFDAFLAVYEGSSAASLTPLGCDDDSGPGDAASLRFSASPHTLYYLQAGGANAESGTLRLSASSRPLNDLSNSLETIVDTPFARRVDTAAATLEQQEDLPTCRPESGATVWYLWQPTANATATIDTAGSDYDTVLAVYTGSAPRDLAQVACNDDVDGARDRRSRLHLRALAGTKYLIQVAAAGGRGGQLALAMSWEAAAPAAPANDALASAIALGAPGFSDARATQGATREAGEPAPSCAPVSGASVWYTLTPPASGPVVLDTAGSDFDTALAVYTGSPGSLAEEACNDDAGAAQGPSRIVLDAAATTYRLQVSGIEGATGNLALSAGPLANDAFSGALPLGPALDASVRQPTAGATRETGEPAPSCSASAGASVWYSFTPAASGTVHLDTLASDYDTVVAVYRGTALGSLDSLACNDDARATDRSVLSFDAVAGIEYRIQASGFRGATGELALRLSDAPPVPQNNDLGAATPGTVGTPGRQSTLGATTEAPETPPSCAPTASSSVWYQITVPKADINQNPPPTTLYAHTIGSRFDTALAVYSGNGYGALTPIACNDDMSATVDASHLSWAATVQVSYYLQVAGVGGAQGDLAFTLDTKAGVAPATASVANDAFAAAAPIAALPFTASLDARGATTEKVEPAPGCQPQYGASVWYRYDATAPLLVSATTDGSTQDAILAAYRGTSLEDLAPVACSDDATDLGPAAALSFPVASGTTYWLQASAFKGTPGDLALRVEGAPLTPPSNDAFGSPALVTVPDSMAGRTHGATAEAGEPAPACASGTGGSVWYRMTPSESFTMTANTFGSDFDTVLAAYSGTSLAALTPVACSDDAAGGDQSQITVPLTAGTRTYLQVSGAAGASGTVRLALARPENDTFGNATAITAASFSQTDRATAGAAREKAEPTSPCMDDSGATIWYRYAPRAPASVSANTNGTTFDTTLAVYRGTAFENLVTVACSDDVSGTNRTSAVSFTAEPGRVYYLQVGGYGGATGEVDFAFNATPLARGNDAFAKAALVTGASYADRRSTSGTTKESGEPSPPCATSASATVWYRIDAAEDGTVTADTAGSDFDTVLAAYRGTALSSLIALACNDDAAAGDPRSSVSFPVARGRSYFVQAAGASGSSGSLAIEIDVVAAPVPPPANDDFAGAITATEPPFTHTMSTAGASVEAGEKVPTCATTSGASVWFRYYPKVHRTLGGTTITVDTTGSTYDTAVAFYTTATSASSAVEPSGACNDNIAAGNPVSRASYGVSANWNGAPIYVQVSGIGDQTGTLVFTLTVARPENDDFVNAYAIPGRPYSKTQGTASATLQTDSDTHRSETGGGHPSCKSGIASSVWYRYTPSEDVSIVADTAGSSFDTVLQASHFPPGLSTLGDRVEVACNDNVEVGKTTSQIGFDAVAGRTYYFQVSGASSGQTGTLVLNVGLLANDRFTGATAIPSTPFTKTQSTATASTESDEPSGCGAASGASVWYSYKPTASELLIARTAGSSYDTVLAVYTGSSLAALTQVACNDDDGASAQSAASWAGAANTTYWLQVRGAAGATGSLTLDVRGPANDDFARAQVAPSAPFSATQSTTKATRETGEPAPSCQDTTARSVWFAYTPPADTTLRAKTAQSTYDTVLAVYTGSSLGTLTERACNDDLSTSDTTSQVTFAATAGTTYRFQVSGFSNASGTLTFAVGAPAAPAAPTGLAATAGPSAGQIRLTWAAPAGGGVDGYRVYRRATGGTLALHATLGSVLTYTDSTLGNGATYVYAVAAFNPGGESATTAEATATTFGAPTAPQNLHTLGGPGPDQITLTWTAPSGTGGPDLVSYEICHGTDVSSQPDCTRVGSANTARVDGGRQFGVTYWYTVAAVNEAGIVGARTAPACARVLPWNEALGCA